MESTLSDSEVAQSRYKEGGVQVEAGATCQVGGSSAGKLSVRLKQAIPQMLCIEGALLGRVVIDQWSSSKSFRSSSI